MKKSVSVIIPTFGRDKYVIQRTIDSILNLDEIKNNHYSFELIVIDQNYPSLELDYSDNHFFLYKKAYADPKNLTNLENSNLLIHVFGIIPSVTRAKNFALELARGDYLIFFDDDVEVHNNCIKNYIDLLDANSNIGFVGGREIVPNVSARRKPWKNFILNMFQFFVRKDDSDYLFQDKYIGRIKPNSTMFWNFDVDTDKLIRIDSARGCNWATTSRALGDLRFDINFKGSALREESDLYMNILSKGYLGYYSAKSIVTHHRQFGGCGNLLSDINTFISKLDNETYFQRKHFKSCSKIWFFMRMLPLALEYLKTSYGTSILLLIKATHQL